MTQAQTQIKTLLGEQFYTIQRLSKDRYLYSLLNNDKVEDKYYVGVARKHNLRVKDVKELFKAVDVYDRHFLTTEVAV
jgi:hypothetical protein